MTESRQTERMVERLPLVYRGAENVSRFMRPWGDEIGRMEGAIDLLMRSRWHSLAEAWELPPALAGHAGWGAADAPTAAKRATALGRFGESHGVVPRAEESEAAYRDRLAESIRSAAASSELGRIGALYGLSPWPEETAARFRERLLTFVSIHRGGLGTASSLLRLAALVYRAEGPPSIAWRDTVAIGTLRVRDGQGVLHEIQLEIHDNPPAPASAAFESVEPGSRLILHNRGLDPAVPTIFVTATQGDIAVPMISHVDTGRQVLFVGHVTQHTTLEIREGKAPLLNRRESDTPVFIADTYRFGDADAVFHHPDPVTNRIQSAVFARFERGFAIPPLPPGESRWRFDTLTRDELDAYLADHADAPALRSQASETRQKVPARIEFRWQEAEPATFTLRIPDTFLPPHCPGFPELAAELEKALDYGRAVGVRGRIELMVSVRREKMDLAERAHVRIAPAWAESQAAQDGFAPPVAGLRYREVVRPSDRFGTEGQFENAYLDHATFTTRSQEDEP